MTNRVLIVGHGTAGKTLAQSVSSKGATVVGYLDDFSTGPDVLGTLGQINSVLNSTPVDLVYFAIPTAPAKKVREFIGSIRDDSIDIAIVPRTYDTLSKETVDISDLTDVDVLDLVGREPVKHDLNVARHYLSGKRVMVTGAAGSIGSRLVEQIRSAGAENVICIDWWENGLFNLDQKLGGDPRITIRVADVKNRSHLEKLFAEFKPDIVFHAAAYKHVPLMQANPVEAIINNVGGTLNLIELSIENAVENFLFVSTDKAVNPVNVMGSTKRLGEMILGALALDSKTRFTAVRFGNVIESNGSVMQIFRDQIRRKMPLTVTHEEVTRFFMTIDEASQLIIQSAALGRSGEIFLLDMGEPVKIIDLAWSLIRAVSPGLGVEITGLRPGEKLHEELSYDPDAVDRTSHEKIFVVKQRPVKEAGAFLSQIRSLLDEANSYHLSNDEAIEQLRSFGFSIQ